MDWGAIIENTARGLFGEQFIYFGLAALGLNIHFGYTGLLNLGQAVFMAAGAYGLSMSVVTLGLNFWWGLLLGIIVFPLILAAIMGVPTLRLRADYLAIVTIAASEMFRIIARSPSLDRWTGSSDGLTGFATTFYELSPYDRQERYLFGLFIGNQMWVVTVGWITLAIVLVISLRLMRSPWGRVLKAIREDEDAARSLGKNAYWYKMQALMIGGVFGAMGGMLRAIGTQSAQPQNFITDVTFFAWVALILGGAAKVLGPVAGAAILYAILSFTDVALRQGVDNGHIPEWLMTGTQVGQVRFMLIGLGLILLAAFRPQGIFGNKEEMALDDR
ncbi:MAG: branched-chain amino acid ABC transporter permease [Actinomycetota bacterium]|nr:branched-chain amino acid ABC transporter permease [Actinomycetota bacterium]MDA3016234.1 branched-chain amino acid ABC transporter permease [Actinomycetota bacterium]MDA3029520.1 branched-chain amino acid ABC transporter permease [Actinomycetota bacterium]